MAEETKDPIEAKIALREQNIRELEKQVSILTEIPYIEGYEQEAATVPIFDKLKTELKFAFSWGKKAKNMSSKYLDISDPENPETAEGNRENTRKFLKEHIGPSKRVINVIGEFEGVQQQIEEVDKNYENQYDKDKSDYDKDIIKANFVITRDKDVNLIIRPADCPVVVIYAKDKKGNPMVVIDHCGRVALNAGMTRQGGFHLKGKYDVDLSTATAVVLPGMARKDFFITDDLLEKGGYRWGNSIMERNWGPWIDEKVDDTSRDEQLRIERNSDGVQKRHVDMTRAAIMQLLEAGFNPKNIEAIDVDSYEASENGEAFSHRFTTQNKGKRPGRFIVAVKLEDEQAEMPVPYEEELAIAA